MSQLSPVRLSLGRSIILLPDGTSGGEARLPADRVQRIPRKRSGTRAARENGAGAKIGAIGRTLPEYFTDDPVMVKHRRYPLASL